ncbi:hypothetical protein [Gimesia alba]|uniref:hypothetical protein n=1 Tax=Gimesia alba TaxID=2527973 RepID=UPI001E4EAEC4|nr:hypothetical protein [Gimesia alba]
MMQFEAGGFALGFDQGVVYQQFEPGADINGFCRETGGGGEQAQGETDEENEAGIVWHGVDPVLEYV